MPALSSLISYRPALKGKVAIKSPFGKRRLDSPTPVPHPFSAPEVIDIADHGHRSSLDFCDSGTPSYDSGDQHPLFDQVAPHPRMQLELDLSPDSEPLSDWFSTSFPKAEPSPKPTGGSTIGNGSQVVIGIEASSVASQSLVSVNGAFGEGIEDLQKEGVSTLSTDVIANLEAMDASSFGKLAYDALPSKIPSPIKIPHQSSNYPNASVSRSGEPSLYGPSRPMSELSSPMSSAVSGTTLARQLIGNTFVLSNDNRFSSKYRTYTGLTRSDSTTLPQDERSIYSNQPFQVGPEAPPIPTNAEALYVPPVTPRTPGLKGRLNTLKRRSSTGSLIVTSPQASATFPISPQPRPTSALLSPTDSEMPFALVPQRRSTSPILAYFQDEDPFHVSVYSQPKKPPPAILVEERQEDQERSVVSPDSNFLSPQSSTGGESTSANHLEDVLDYYSSDNPEASNNRGFQPVFTPITEESMSQLSPPTPYRGDRRESQRSQPIGARNPLNMGSFRGRAAFVSPRRPSDGGLSGSYPLADQPFSVQVRSSFDSVASSHASNSSTSSINSDLNGPLQPPPLSKLFNRRRSGSAPSPIKVIRDSKDLASYNITVAAQPDSVESTPTTGDTDAAKQTFPETPNAFSPMWTAGSVVSPGMASNSFEYSSIPMSNIPLSAALPSRNSSQPSLAQQILLTRSATSVRVARHSRQASRGRGGHAYGPPSSPLSNRRIDEHAESLSEEVEDTSDSSVTIQRETKEIPPQRPPPQCSLPPSPIFNKLTLQAQVSTSSQDHLIPLNDISTLSLNHSVTSSHIRDTMSRSPSKSSSIAHSSDNLSVSTHSSDESSRSRIKSLPPIPLSPIEQPSPTEVAKAPRGRVPPALQLSDNSIPHLAQVLTEEPETIPTQNHDSASKPSTMQEQTEEQVQQSPAESPTMAAQTSQSQKSINTIDDLFRTSTNLGSPPPYYTVVNEERHNLATLHMESSGHDTYMFGPHPVSVSASQSSWSSSNEQHARDSTSGNTRARMRPPLPAGPRRPTTQTAALGSPASYPVTRDRAGSTSSIGSGALHASRRFYSSPLMSPKFQAPAVKWRGYTMEAAKWTFSSAQLQSVVSRAIKQSAEASAIRLLKMESLETEIPEEMHRLEMHRTDVKHKYKALTRRRAGLFDSLFFHLTRAAEESSTFALRLAEDLKDIAVSLDKLAEELHVTDEQIAQLDSLCQTHSASALSMALRKLNNSFLKQLTENQTLREQILVLEAERDEAWKQAEEVASEYDHHNFNEGVDSPSSKRSSRIFAKRKSSIRVSKAGLRSGSRRHSQRSSIGSSAHAFSSTPSSSRSPFRLDKMPPVPPIPKRRPVGIITDYRPPLTSSDVGTGDFRLPGRSSYPHPLSSDGITPDSETRAMVQAQEELYSMLGISLPDSRFRRSHSVIGLPSASEVLFSAQQPLSARLNTTYRRSSLPGESALVEAHNAMLADRNAVLTTFEMIQDES